MNYLQHSAEEFAADEYFIKWIKFPDAETDAFWKHWIFENPGKIEVIREARNLVEAITIVLPDMPEERLDLVWNKIESTNEGWKGLQENKVKKIRSSFFTWQKVAAVLGGLLITSLFIYFTFYSETKIVQVAKYGETKKIILPDNTYITLNADSRVSYYSDFSKRKQREVFLEGEAFFDVAKDKRKPFIVHTKDLNIKVLGTSFNVKSYNDDETTETALVTGIVTITTNGKSKGEKKNLLLKPNQIAVFDRKTTSIQKVDQSDVQIFTSWKEDKLFFKNEQYSSVIRKLERRFAVKIHLEGNDIGTCGFTGRFQGESLYEILQVIKRTSYIDYNVSGDDIYIKGKFCK